MRLDPNGPAWVAVSLADLAGWTIQTLQFWKPGVVRVECFQDRYFPSGQRGGRELRTVFVGDRDLARRLELACLCCKAGGCVETGCGCHVAGT